MECYVCTGGGNVLTNVCLCTDRYIHEECQRKLISTIERDGKCSVCKQKYSNVSVQAQVFINKHHICLRIGEGLVGGCIVISSFLIGLQMITLTKIRPFSICYSINTTTSGLDSCLDTTSLAYGAISLTILFLFIIICVCFYAHTMIVRKCRSIPLFLEEVRIRVYRASSNNLALAPSSLDVACEQTLETREE